MSDEGYIAALLASLTEADAQFWQKGLRKAWCGYVYLDPQSARNAAASLARDSRRLRDARPLAPATDGMPPLFELRVRSRLRRRVAERPA